MTNEQWLQWLAATLVAGISGTFALVVYAHGTFSTREDVTIRNEFLKTQISEIKEHLIRIENKLDKK